MIDLDQIYTFEECARLCNKNEYYFRKRVNDHTIVANAKDPKRPYMKAIYGRDLVRHLQTVNWGRNLLEYWGVAEIDDKEFVKQDIEILEDKLRHLMITKEQRLKALYVTMSKIEEIEEKLKNLNKLK